MSEAIQTYIAKNRSKDDEQESDTKKGQDDLETSHDKYPFNGGGFYNAEYTENRVLS